MFGVKYDIWKSVCDMYFSLKTGSLKAYLQWFPFTKLTKADNDVTSEELQNSIKALSKLVYDYVDSNKS